MTSSQMGRLSHAPKLQRKSQKALCINKPDRTSMALVIERLHVGMWD